ncbi:MAG: hypothetical protein KAZ18_00300 [Acinetobacter sp.]|nr:hypothetical protein [Acinetobacter sp.]
MTTTNVLTTGTQGPVGPRGPAGDPALIELLQTQISALASTKLDAADYVQHFRGLFTSYVNLSTQVPSAIDGDYAHIKENETFGVMEAIWDSVDGKWVISAVNVGSNTDEMPEGSTNLYFTSERVRQVTLNGLDTSNPVQISATDTIVQALGKAQAQLNNASSSIEWADMSVVGNVPAHITDQGIFFARWNGLLVAKMKFRCGQVGFAFPILTITNDSYKVKGTPFRSLIGRIGAENNSAAIRDIDLEILSSGDQSLYFSNTSISTTNTYRMNWVVIGELLN